MTHGDVVVAEVSVAALYTLPVVEPVPLTVGLVVKLLPLPLTLVPLHTVLPDVVDPVSMGSPVGGH